MEVAATYSKLSVFDEFPDKQCDRFVLFSEGMRAFLDTWAEEAKYIDVNDGSEHFIDDTWILLLVRKTPGDKVVPLYIVEENATGFADFSCAHCVQAGWGDRVITRMRYRFIVPMDADWRGMIADGFEEEGTLLHGLIHRDGYGHLIQVNGISGGSSMLTGKDLMDLWDRICSALPTRAISVEDNSVKLGRLRGSLLYGVAYRQPWFGQWGYTVHHGTFGLTFPRYKDAVQFLNALPMEDVFGALTVMRSELEVQFERFKQIANANLGSLGEFVNFVLKSDETCNADIMWIYDNVLLSTTRDENIRNAVTSLLRAKHLKKEWELKDLIMDSKTTFILEVYIPAQFMNFQTNQILPIIVDSSSTVVQLKENIKNLLMQTFHLNDGFQIAEVRGLSTYPDHCLVAEVSRSELSVDVQEADFVPGLWIESGEPQVVRCVCGAMVADGEPLMICEEAICSNQVHIECRGAKVFFRCSQCTRKRKQM